MATTGNKEKWQIKVTLDPAQDAEIWDEIMASVKRGAAAATTIKAMLAECMALREFKTLALALSGTCEEPIGGPRVTSPEPVRSHLDEGERPPLDLMEGFLPD